MAYWITDDRTPPEHSVIVTAEPLGAPRVLFTAARASAHMQGLKVNSDWMVWLENVDSQTWHDSQLYAARRGGTRVLIDDMSRYGDLVTFPEFALDGNSLYWSVPEIAGGTWRGRLFRRDLATGDTASVVDGNGVIFSAPAAAYGRLAYEVAGSSGDNVMFVRIRDGATTRDIPGPASEPSLGPNYIAFKRGNRFEPGSIEVELLDNPIRIAFGHGEAPRANGAYATWFDNNANEAILARPSDGCAVAASANRGRTDGVALLSAVADDARMGWTGIKGSGGAITEFVSTAPIVQLRC